MDGERVRRVIRAADGARETLLFVGTPAVKRYCDRLV